MESIIPSNKKGQLGLDTVQAVIIVFLVLAVLGITLLLVLPQIQDVAEGIDTSSGTLKNETVTTLNETTGDTLSIHGNYHEITYSNTIVTNLSGTVVESGNYTLKADGKIYGVAGATHNGKSVNVSTSWKGSNMQTQRVVGNVTRGTTDFFGDTGTIFSILVVVVIILAITIIILSVRRFGDGSVQGL